MLEKERHVYIMERLREKGFVSVRDLMKELDISRSSAMRDLISLESQGLLVREHGGATLHAVSETLSRRNEPAVNEKENVYSEEKAEICRLAALEIRDNTCIYIDSGTTTSYLLPYISDRDVTIVTPSLFLVRKLPEFFKGTVFIAGGMYDRKYDMVTGDFSTQLIRQFNFDLALFSANGINLKNGEVTLADYNIAGMKQMVMKRCHRNVLLADSSKISQIAACTFANINEFDLVYIGRNTEEELPDNFIVAEGEK